MTYNKTVLAQLNRKIVLEMIREKGPINKAEIAKQAGLSIPTVMKITEDFENQNLVRNVGKGESTGGKRPDLLEFVSDAFYVMGIDIGREHVKMVIMDMDASVLESNSFLVEDEKIRDPDAFLKEICIKAEEMLAGFGMEPGRFMGIGIGMPGILDYENGNVVFSPDYNWTDVPLMQILKQHLSYRIMVENSNRTLALGEYIFGAAKGSEYMFCINLGYGIGGAIINQGKISRGMSGSSGEFGHMVMDPDGPLCDCGNNGCLEAIASGNAIAKRMVLELANGKESMVSNGMLANSAKIEAKDVFLAARMGDMLSREIINYAMANLGIAIASCINLLDPDMIILAGGLTKSGDFFMKSLNDTIQCHKMRHSGRKTQIRLGKLGDYGTAIGAATLLVQEFIENGGQLP